MYARRSALRVTFDDLPAPFAQFNGTAMWVGTPQAVTEIGGSVDPIAGAPNFTAATLQCAPLYTDWSADESVHVYHAAIIPEGTYSVQVIGEGCSTSSEIDFSDPLVMSTNRWGDVVGPFDAKTESWTAPNGTVDITSDVVAMLSKFSSEPGAPVKSRVDIHPATPDQKISILDAFRGFGFPYEPDTPPCGGS
ncbi:MAG: hypothetical protein IH898_08780 [Planctomycetes bacterium]|nr:hypothetical protein [Planctomycetota bacterium]